MRLILQFPIVDTRRFLSVETGVLPRPQWHSPDFGKTFVRSFGLINQGFPWGLSGWLAETATCNARRAIRFPDLTPFNEAAGGRGIPFQIESKRFFFDGVSMAKLEVTASIGDERLAALEGHLPAALFHHFLDLPVLIPNPLDLERTPVRCRLWEAGKYLANLYEQSSTRTVGRSEMAEHQNWWVEPGNVLMLIEHKGIDHEAIPFWGRSVSLAQSATASLSYHVIPKGARDIRMWAVNTQGLSRPEIEKLKRVLLRMHAERECLRRTLVNIERMGGTANSDALQKYVNESTRRIFRLEKHADKQGEDSLVDLALEAEEEVSPAEREAIMAALEQNNFRLNIRRKAEQVLDASSRELANIYVQALQQEQLNLAKLELHLALSADAGEQVTLQLALASKRERIRGLQSQIDALHEGSARLV